MRTILILFLSLGLCAGENSNIHGTVLDFSGRSVEAARVTCQDQSVYTNAEGRFSIPGVDKCSAKIEKAGFITQTVLLTAATEARITLEVAGHTESVDPQRRSRLRNQPDHHRRITFRDPGTLRHTGWARRQRCIAHTYSGRGGHAQQPRARCVPANPEERVNWFDRVIRRHAGNGWPARSTRSAGIAGATGTAGCARRTRSTGPSGNGHKSVGFRGL